MNRQTCASCVFFGVSFEHQRYSEAFAPCRRFPPKDTDTWPHVHGYGWCGEHKPADATS
jgi:hypothetical protein